VQETAVIKIRHPEEGTCSGMAKHALEGDRYKTDWRSIHTMDFHKDPRFKQIQPLEHKVWLASPTMHGGELRYMKEAYDTNWMSTTGENIDELERLAAAYIGVKHAVALSCGTAALHLAVKLAAERLYNSSTGISTPSGLGPGGSLKGIRVFCPDMTFAATVNPVVYEGGEPVFIDTEADTWNMDPKALERAFQLYPQVKLVILTHLYGIPAKVEEIKDICKAHGALLVEDAAESLGAVYKGRQTGSFGDYGVISFNGNKIITGSSGGMLLVNDKYSADKVRKWSTQSREGAPWYQHEEVGYNYRISNVIAGIVRGQWEYLEEHIGRKRQVYERYRKGLSGMPVTLSPGGDKNRRPNFWLSAMVIAPEAMCETQRSEREAVYRQERGKSCPTEVLDALEAFQAEGRPIWKPMHMQPIYANNGFVTKDGNGRGRSNAYISGPESKDTGSDIFRRGVCLPSDIKMTEEQQNVIIQIIRQCFQ